MTYFDIMLDTTKLCHTDTELKSKIQNSISRQRLYKHGCNIEKYYISQLDSTKYIVSGQRSFEAAKKYRDKKTVVLNFANNHSIGGNPFYANAQEECLCRCSTLLPCLEAMKHDFYEYHEEMIKDGRLNYMGNDDIIYTPEVIVFKSDENYPITLPKEKWYKVNVISSAAPELWRGPIPSNYETVIEERLRRILDIAAVNDNQVLILGAWGCGAFRNPPEIIARTLYKLLSNYSFETVEFAIGSLDINYRIFMDSFRKRLKCLPQESIFYSHNKMFSYKIDYVKEIGDAYIVYNAIKGEHYDFPPNFSQVEVIEMFVYNKDSRGNDGCRIKSSHCNEGQYEVGFYNYIASKSRMTQEEIIKRSLLDQDAFIAANNTLYYVNAFTKDKIKLVETNKYGIFERIRRLFI